MEQTRAASARTRPHGGMQERKGYEPLEHTGRTNKDLAEVAGRGARTRKNKCRVPSTVRRQSMCQEPLF